MAKLVPGEQFHILMSGLTIQTGVPGRSGTVVSYRGMTITTTSALLEASVDRFGDSWLDAIDDMDGQVARYGEVVMARGEFPSDLKTYTPGTVEETMARDAARAVAAAIVDPNEQARALAAVTRQYGVETTQQSAELWGGRFQ